MWFESAVEEHSVKRMMLSEKIVIVCCQHGVSEVVCMILTTNNNRKNLKLYKLYTCKSLALALALPCGTWCIPSDTSIISDYALNTLFHIGGTPRTTCGTNYELEDNAECTYSGTRKLACNTCSMILTIYNNKKLEIVQTVHM